MPAPWTTVRGSAESQEFAQPVLYRGERARPGCGSLRLATNIRPRTCAPWRVPREGDSCVAKMSVRLWSIARREGLPDRKIPDAAFPEGYLRDDKIPTKFSLRCAASWLELPDAQMQNNGRRAVTPSPGGRGRGEGGQVPAGQLTGGGGRETGKAKAERLVRAGLRALGWTEKELSKRRKGDKGKVKLARRLRAETTMTLRWIAGRLQMGSWTHVSNLLREKR